MTTRLARSTIAAAAMALAALFLPAGLTPAGAVSGPDVPPGFDRVPAGIPAADVALDRALAVFGGDDAAGADAKIALRDLSARLTELSGDDRRVAEALLARPNGGKKKVDSNLGALWPGLEAPDSPLCSVVVQVCVHWTDTSRHAPPLTDDDLSGFPDQVERTLQVMEEVWQKEVVELGYRRPLTDERASIDNDGPNFDVYLSDIGAKKLYGYCAIDDSRTFANYKGYDRSGYCVVDDDFSKDQFRQGTPLNNLRVTAAHEFFHAVQFAYDAYEDPWFMEGTAAWIEDEVYDAVNDNLQYLRNSPMAEPQVSLDESRGMSVYGSWIFFRYLSERFGTDLVRQAWARADSRPGRPDDYSLQAVRRVLGARGADLSTVFADFSRVNHAPRNFYSEGGSYRTPPLAKRKLGGDRTTTGWLRARLNHLTSASLGLIPNSSAGKRDSLRIQVNGPARSTRPQAQVLVAFSNGTYQSKRVSLNRKGDGAVTVPFGRTTVKRVTAVLVNGSDRFYPSSCYQYETPFACGGAFPRDDGKAFRVKATVR